MTRSRIWFVSAILIGSITGSLFDMVTGNEHWPFSNYPMYNRVPRKPTTSQLVLFGVTENAPPREIPLVADRYTEPFSPKHLGSALAGLLRKPQGRTRGREALRGCLANYDRLRRVQRHDGPPLRALRLYRLHWKLDPWARNVERPDRRELLLEFSRPPGREV